ncbi:hypothetical protein CO613_10225 [Lysobacteraceae bacterium NML07-0707]|nr:hypothetical protein CO613_10225 [Xanthomonadaceae bacterium NML07-0707]
MSVVSCVKKAKAWSVEKWDTVKGYGGKAAVAATGLVASGMAAAQSSSPGQAIASELSGGKAEVMLIVGAVAVILGVIILWGYIKKAR